LQSLSVLEKTEDDCFLYSHKLKIRAVFSSEQQNVGQGSEKAPAKERKRAETSGTAVTPGACKKRKTKTEISNKRMSPESIPGNATVQFGISLPNKQNDVSRAGSVGAYQALDCATKG
jgi:hypothetical protein